MPALSRGRYATELVVISVVSFLMVEALLSIPLLLTYRKVIPGWFEFIVCIVLASVILFANKPTKWKVMYGSILVAACWILINQWSYSTRLFWGKIIASAFHAEVPCGFIELNLFRSNRCLYEREPIIGPSTKYQGTYSIANGVINVDIDVDLLELKGDSVEINGEKYIVHQGPNM